MTINSGRATGRTPNTSLSARRLRGQVARQVAGVETVEIKSTVSAPHIVRAVKHIGLKPQDASARYVYFFDTPKLELFRARIIVRARRVPGGVHETTVKIRPVNPAQIPAKWKKMKGFKLEADWGDGAIVVSASLTRPVGKGLIKSVAAGKKPLRAIFDKEQELFLAEMCRIRYDLDKLAMFGPIEVKWWRVTHPGVPGRMTAELWHREDRKALLETSMRVPPAQAAFANAGFAAFLAEVGACADNAEQAKTRWALTGETPELVADRTKRKQARKAHLHKQAKPVKGGKKSAAKEGRSEKQADPVLDRVAAPVDSEKSRKSSRHSAARPAKEIADAPAAASSHPAQTVN